MKRLSYIVCCVLGLTACGSTSTIAVDDAYIWPDKTTPVSTPAETASPATVSEPVSEPVSTGPTLEYTNIQDTTITVRIKR